jgi:transcriptional regulator with XRE-family HTH domain
VSETERAKIGERLRKAREYLGLSQEEAATHLQIPRTAISLIESGQRKVDLLELKKLAALYQRPVGYFVGSEEPKLPKVGDVEVLQRAANGLSAQDVQEVLKFAEFLKSRAAGKSEDGKK